MKNIQKQIIAFVLVAILASAEWGELSAAKIARADWNYITLSPYYALPGQRVTVNGAGFTPNEPVSVNLAGLNQTVNADSSGAFSTNGFTVPTSSVGSEVAVTASGGSGDNSQAILTVGGYYPTVSPNSYYIVPGGQVNFTGKNFAPNEPISISDNGTAIGAVTADGGGSFYTQAFIVPSSSDDQSYSFIGQDSKASYNIVVRVSGTQAVLVLNNYYGMSGSVVNATGQFYGANEAVGVSIGGVTLGRAMADANGSFNFSFSIPNFPASAIQAVIATGLTTGKSASASYTIAWNNNMVIASASPLSIAVVQTDQPKLNISSTTPFTVAPELIAQGGDADNINVIVGLSNAASGQTAASQSFDDATLLQNAPVFFDITAPPLDPGSYNVFTTVNNSSGGVIVSFPNLGGVTVQ